MNKQRYDRCPFHEHSDEGLHPFGILNSACTICRPGKRPIETYHCYIDCSPNSKSGYNHVYKAPDQETLRSIAFDHHMFGHVRSSLDNTVYQLMLAGF